MKRPLAYITAAWCGDLDTDMEIAARYCRMAYEAGFSPICPILYLPLFINDDIPEEHKSGIDMRRDMLRRSHVLVVCGGDVDEDVMILSRLVDTFFSRILYPMLPLSGNHSIAVV